MKNTLILDFETKDVSLTVEKRAGWVKGISDSFKPLCVGIQYNEEEPRIIEDFNKLKEYLHKTDIMVCHNASYDVPILHILGLLDIKTTKIQVVDTSVLGKLFDNTLMSHGLDDLSKKYLGKEKKKSILGQLALELGLTNRSIGAEKVAYKNMDILYEMKKSVIHEYCIADIELTRDLYKFFQKNLYKIDLDFYSDLSKVVMCMQMRGIKVDVERVNELNNIYAPMKDALEQDIKDLLGDININSPKQLIEFFNGEGHSTKKVDKDGSIKDTVDSEWLEACSHPAADKILKYREVTKLVSTYITPVLESGDSVIHSSLKIFGAKRTGRMASSAPNMQNIPTRGEHGKLIRSMYIPHEGELWASQDYSGQEFRLAVEFAARAGIRSGVELAKGYQDNPEYDAHSVVAELMGVSRTHAKALNFGLLYGKSANRFKEELNLSEEAARELLNKYHTAVPFIKDMNALISKTMQGRGYLISLLGRHIKKDGPSYIWLNKLLQGSGSDMTNQALVNMFREGIIPYLPIHDSIEYGSTGEDMDLVVKRCMEKAVDTIVPFITDIKKGKSWGSLEKI